MKPLILLLGLFLTIGSFGQAPSRELKTLTFSGNGYELGLQHGTQLKTEIAAIIRAWKENTSSALGKDADAVLKDFYQYADFTTSIKKWTPHLYEEIRGIAEGSNQAFNDVLVLNLLDEFWVYVNNLHNHHCSGLGVPAKDGQPGYISQNMDLENYTDGFQILMRLERNETRPEQLILTYPGLIALNGLNEAGVGVCVNTLMQLQASVNGLPVAFVIRRIINSSDKEELLSFIQTVRHASGQNYIIGIKGEVFDFEASANKVVRYNPQNKNGTVYHTNHPIVNDDLKPWFKEYDPKLMKEVSFTNSNTHLRFRALENRMKANTTIDEHMIKATLRSKDNKDHPVCRTNMENGFAFTFASIIMTLSEKPYIQILAGPPDESDFIRVDFSEKE